MNCRHCQAPLSNVFADLQNSPPSNSFLTEKQIDEVESYFPLKIYSCDSCYLVQIDEYKSAQDIFNGEYVYFSSYSTSWLNHAKIYSEMMVDRFGLNETSSVIEIASNDGYLLQYFHEKNIPVLGVDPTANTAAVAQGKGIETLVKYFGIATAQEMVVNNQKEIGRASCRERVSISVVAGS